MCDHVESLDPRRAGLCAKCSKRIGGGAPAPSPVDPNRDLSFEAGFLNRAVEVAQRMTGISNPAYGQLVADRLEVGRQRYGDGDFLSKDNLLEVREETPDIASYAMLELRKQQILGLDQGTYDELELDLVAAAAYGAVADWYAQRASRRLAR